MTAEAARYVGTELELFAEARRWKRYVRARLRRHLRGAVLEVGAGIGTTTLVLSEGHAGTWSALEPDPELSRIAASGAAAVGAGVRHVVGTVADLPPAPSFDTVVYVDVLEHIGDDRAEVARAAELLREGGRLVVLAPAHQWLYTAFDEAIGHHRRYGRGALESVAGPELRLETLFLLDSVGLLASGANRLLLRSSLPSVRQIKVWDRLLVPLSRVLDPLLRWRVGRSIVAVWVKRTQP